MRLRKSKLPGKSGVIDGISRSRAGSAVKSRDQNNPGPGLCDAGGYRSHPGLGNKLNGDSGILIGVLQIIDQLCQILNGINIMVRRRGDKAYPRR